MNKMKIIIPFLICFCISGCLIKQNDLDNSWKYYKTQFVTSDGRVVDKGRKSITTSEGQSYALLKSVLENDRQTFDKVYKWTEDNLSRKNDHLFAWLWGKRSYDTLNIFDDFLVSEIKRKLGDKATDGSWNVIDYNTAADADIDIAVSLLIAYDKWKDKKYLDKALLIINDIWKYEIKEINLQRILVAGVEQAGKNPVILNPSYYTPYAFRKFAKFDKKHNWNSLVDSSYDLLLRVSSATKTGLPPDWFNMDPNTGQILFDLNSERSNFSYDAIRTYLRIYVDYLVTGDTRAYSFLSSVKFFINNYKDSPNRKFYTYYTAYGDRLNLDEDTGAIAALLPAVGLFDKETATDIYNFKIKNQYKQQGYWYKPDEYYLQNLVWFSLWVESNKKEIKKLYN